MSEEIRSGYPVDIAWLLDVVERLPGGPPAIVDYGALVAALARVEAVVLGRRVYVRPHHQAAALLHQLARVPALERGNRLFAAASAVAYLAACGVHAVPDLQEMSRLTVDAAEGRLDIGGVSWVLRNWIKNQDGPSHASTASLWEDEDTERDADADADTDTGYDANSARVRVYLDDATDSEAVESALTEVLRAFDIEVVRRLDPIIGSWFRELFIRGKRSDSLKGQLAKLERAIDLQTHLRTQAQIDADQGGAVAKLITALEKTPNAVIQSGSLLLVKVGDNLAVRNLTQRELVLYERDPRIFRDPAAAFDLLQELAEEVVDDAVQNPALNVPASVPPPPPKILASEQDSSGCE